MQIYELLFFGETFDTPVIRWRIQFSSICAAAAFAETVNRILEEIDNGYRCTRVMPIL